MLFEESSDFEALLPKLSRRSLRETSVRQEARLRRREGGAFRAELQVGAFGGLPGGGEGFLFEIRDLSGEDALRAELQGFRGAAPHAERDRSRGRLRGPAGDRGLREPGDGRAPAGQGGARRHAVPGPPGLRGPSRRARQDPARGIRRGAPLRARVPPADGKRPVAGRGEPRRVADRLRRQARRDRVRPADRRGPRSASPRAGQRDEARRGVGRERGGGAAAERCARRRDRDAREPALRGASGPWRAQPGRLQPGGAGGEGGRPVHLARGGARLPAQAGRARTLRRSARRRIRDAGRAAAHDRVLLAARLRPRRAPDRAADLRARREHPQGAREAPGPRGRGPRADPRPARGREQGARRR